MKPTDVTEQLLGEFTAWDQPSEHSYIFDGCSKFDGATCQYDLESGIFEVVDIDGDVTQSFAIKAELVPITEA